MVQVARIQRRSLNVQGGVFGSRAAVMTGLFTTTEALRAVIDYIHANPMRRGLVASAEDWQWSGARWYAELWP
jgi:hypothetical protein